MSAGPCLPGQAWKGTGLTFRPSVLLDPTVLNIMEDPRELWIARVPSIEVNLRLSYCIHFCLDNGEFTT